MSSKLTLQANAKAGLLRDQGQGEGHQNLS